MVQRHDSHLSIDTSAASNTTSGRRRRTRPQSDRNDTNSDIFRIPPTAVYGGGNQNVEPTTRCPDPDSTLDTIPASLSTPRSFWEFDSSRGFVARTTYEIAVMEAENEPMISQTTKGNLPGVYTDMPAPLLVDPNARLPTRESNMKYGNDNIRQHRRNSDIKNRNDDIDLYYLTNPSPCNKVKKMASLQVVLPPIVAATPPPLSRRRASTTINNMASIMSPGTPQTRKQQQLHNLRLLQEEIQTREQKTPIAGQRLTKSTAARSSNNVLPKGNPAVLSTNIVEKMNRKTAAALAAKRALNINKVDPLSSLPTPKAKKVTTSNHPQRIRKGEEKSSAAGWSAITKSRTLHETELEIQRVEIILAEFRSKKYETEGEIKRLEARLKELRLIREIQKLECAIHAFGSTKVRGDERPLQVLPSTEKVEISSPVKQINQSCTMEMQRLQSDIDHLTFQMHQHDQDRMRTKRQQNSELEQQHASPSSRQSNNEGTQTTYEPLSSDPVNANRPYMTAQKKSPPWKKVILKKIPPSIKNNGIKSVSSFDEKISLKDTFRIHQTDTIQSSESSKKYESQKDSPWKPNDVPVQRIPPRYPTRTTLRHPSSPPIKSISIVPQNSMDDMVTNGHDKYETLRRTISNDSSIQTREVISGEPVPEHDVERAPSPPRIAIQSEIESPSTFDDAELDNNVFNFTLHEDARVEGEIYERIYDSIPIDDALESPPAALPQPNFKLNVEAEKEIQSSNISNQPTIAESGHDSRTTNASAERGDLVACRTGSTSNYRKEAVMTRASFEFKQKSLQAKMATGVANPHYSLRPQHFTLQSAKCDDSGVDKRFTKCLDTTDVSTSLHVEKLAIDTSGINTAHQSFNKSETWADIEGTSILPVFSKEEFQATNDTLVSSKKISSKKKDSGEIAMSAQDSMDRISLCRQLSEFESQTPPNYKETIDQTPISPFTYKVTADPAAMSPATNPNSRISTLRAKRDAKMKHCKETMNSVRNDSFDSPQRKQRIDEIRDRFFKEKEERSRSSLVRAHSGDARTLVVNVDTEQPIDQHVKDHVNDSQDLLELVDMTILPSSPIRKSRIERIRERVLKDKQETLLSCGDAIASPRKSEEGISQRSMISETVDQTIEEGPIDDSALTAKEIQGVFSFRQAEDPLLPVKEKQDLILSILERTVGGEVFAFKADEDPALRVKEKQETILASLDKHTDGEGFSFRNSEDPQKRANELIDHFEKVLSKDNESQCESNKTDKTIGTTLVKDRINTIWGSKNEEHELEEKMRRRLQEQERVAALVKASRSKGSTDFEYEYHSEKTKSAMETMPTALDCPAHDDKTVIVDTSISEVWNREAHFEPVHRKDPSEGCDSKQDMSTSFSLHNENDAEKDDLADNGCNDETTTNENISDGSQTTGTSSVVEINDATTKDIREMTSDGREEEKSINKEFESVTSDANVDIQLDVKSDIDVVECVDEDSVQNNLEEGYFDIDNSAQQLLSTETEVENPTSDTDFLTDEELELEKKLVSDLDDMLYNDTDDREESFSRNDVGESNDHEKECNETTLSSDLDAVLYNDTDDREESFSRNDVGESNDHEKECNETTLSDAIDEVEIDTHHDDTDVLAGEELEMAKKLSSDLNAMLCNDNSVNEPCESADDVLASEDMNDKVMAQTVLNHQESNSSMHEVEHDGNDVGNNDDHEDEDKSGNSSSEGDNDHEPSEASESQRSESDESASESEEEEPEEQVNVLDDEEIKARKKAEMLLKMCGISNESNEDSDSVDGEDEESESEQEDQSGSNNSNDDDQEGSGSPSSDEDDEDENDAVSEQSDECEGAGDKQRNIEDTPAAVDSIVQSSSTISTPSSGSNNGNKRGFFGFGWNRSTSKEEDNSKDLAVPTKKSDLQSSSEDSNDFREKRGPLVERQKSSSPSSSIQRQDIGTSSSSVSDNNNNDSNSSEKKKKEKKNDTGRGGDFFTLKRNVSFSDDEPDIKNVPSYEDEDKMNCFYDKSDLSRFKCDEDARKQRKIAKKISSSIGSATAGMASIWD